MIQEKNQCAKCEHSACFLKLLSEEELSKYFNNKVELTFKKGQIICKEGSFANNVYFLKKGLVKIYTEGEKKNLILSFYRDPTYLGLLSSFGNDFYNYSISALEDSSICIINLNGFKELIKQNGDFGLKVITNISRSANFLLNTKIKSGQKQIRGKLAFVLLFLSEHIYKSLSFTLPVTRKELSEFAGMSTENLITQLTEFKNEGLILNDGKKFELLRVDLLKEISEKN